MRRTLRSALIGQSLALPIGVVAASVALAVLMLVVVLGIGADDDPQRSEPQQVAGSTVSVEPERSVRYVPYNGLANSDPEETEPSVAKLTELHESSPPLPVLSDVLTDEYDESELSYGSDGAEGGILPLDNGVVASSRLSSATSWELILPSAGIRASVVQVGLTFDGAMGSPDNPFVIGWYNRSAVPGQLGNALLGGHRDYEDRDGHVDVGVCWELDHTRIGDQLIMYDQSTDRYYVYDVVNTATVHPDSSEAATYMSQTRESVVTLITCSGNFDAETNSYDARIVVVALLNAVAVPDV